MTRFRAPILAALAVGAASLLGAPADAHTDADVVAVPAGEEATVKLKPNHGCGDSPTVEVAIRVPVAGATAVAVPGWTATATPDGAGRTVVEWKGGSLPVDEVGAFPVQFVAPDRVGDLLVFPAVQACANGEELSWISGDPAADYPAPRLLVLPAGSAAATTIDDVPADAPGRAKLEAVVAASEVPGATTSVPPTTGVPATTTTAAATTTSAAPDGEGAGKTRAGRARGEDDEGPSTAVLWGGTAATLAFVLAGGLFLRRRAARG